MLSLEWGLLVLAELDAFVLKVFSQVLPLSMLERVLLELSDSLGSVFYSFAFV